MKKDRFLKIGIALALLFQWELSHAEEAAEVCICRKQFIAAGISNDILIDDQHAAELKNRRYVKIKIKPGQRHFQAKWPSSSSIPEIDQKIDVQPGASLYFRLFIDGKIKKLDEVNQNETIPGTLLPLISDWSYLAYFKSVPEGKLSKIRRKCNKVETIDLTQ